MSTTRTIDPHAAVLDMRPQAYGRGRADQVSDPIIEPQWFGRRVLVALDQERGATMVEGGEVVDGRDEVATALVAALGAESAILDGMLFKTGLYDAAAALGGNDRIPPATGFVAQSLFGSRRNERKAAQERTEREVAARVFLPGDTIAFVALDLPMLDDQWLLDVPLLERKRLLDAVVTEGEQIRRGMYVRAPVERWLGPWRGQGFSGIVFKAANGRYRPGGTKDDWITMSMPNR